jgi:hypothetical protein
MQNAQHEARSGRFEQSGLAVDTQNGLTVMVERRIDFAASPVLRLYMEKALLAAIVRASTVSLLLLAMMTMHGPANGIDVSALASATGCAGLLCLLHLVGNIATKMRQPMYVSLMTGSVAGSATSAIMEPRSDPVPSVSALSPATPLPGQTPQYWQTAKSLDMARCSNRL